MRPSVYLSGPITGHDYVGCTDWREFAVGWLSKYGIDGFSPMRHQKYREEDGKTILANYPVDPFNTKAAITHRDRWDSQRCDVLLVNLQGATAVSIGTVMEIAWADSVGKPIVAVGVAVDTDSDLLWDMGVHRHAMLEECLPYKVCDLEEGLEIIRRILTISHH